jgi:hypothetical protein
MRAKSLSLAATLLLTVAMVQVGCKKEPPAGTAPAPGAASTSPESAPATQPAGATAAAPAQPGAAAAPATAAAPAAEPAAPPMPPPPPPPVKLTAAAGTTVNVSITQQLSASKNDVGDSFTGVLAAPVKTSGGTTMFPKGAHVMGTVVASKGRGKFKGSGALGIQVTSIGGVAVSVNEYEKEEKGKGKRSAAMIGGGAGGGALIGGLAGGGKGALIGGLIGAGAGTAGAAFTGNKDVVIPSESVIAFHLTAPVTITVQPKADAGAPPADENPNPTLQTHPQ